MYTVSLDKIRIGSKIKVRGGFGSEPAKLVTVDGVDADIKNGRPGIDYTESDGTGRWAYLDQVLQVVAY
jgi:hypothetical protein